MRYIRNAPTRSENFRAALASAAVALGVGVTAFYLTRIFLARDPFPRKNERPPGLGQKEGPPA